HRLRLLGRPPRGGWLGLSPSGRPPFRRRLGGPLHPVTPGCDRRPKGLARRDSPAITVFVTGNGAHARAAAASRIDAGEPGVRPGRPFTRGRATFVPLAYTGKSSNAIDEATKLRHALVQTTATTQTRVIGEPAIWSNFQSVSKQELAQ